MMWVCKQPPSKGHFPIGSQSFRPSSDTSSRPGGQACIRALTDEITLKLGQRTHQPRHVQGDRGMEGTLENDIVPERIVSKRGRPHIPSMNANTSAW